MEDNPLVSVIIPVYNGSNYLADAIHSVLNQDYNNIELIVVNDGSTDDGKTKEIADFFKFKLKYYEKANGGVYSALNYGIEKMTGRYFVWLSHDDLLSPEMITSHILLRTSQNDNENIITYNFHQRIDGSGNKMDFITAFTNPTSLLSALTYSFPIYLCACLIPKAVLDKGYAFSQSPIWADHKFLVDLAANYSFVYVPKVLSFMRTHSEQISSLKKYQNKSMLEHTNDALSYAMNVLINNQSVKKDVLYNTAINLAKNGYCKASLNSYYYYKKTANFFMYTSLRIKIGAHCIIKALKRKLKKVLSLEFTIKKIPQDKSENISYS